MLLITTLEHFAEMVIEFSRHRIICFDILCCEESGLRVLAFIVAQSTYIIDFKDLNTKIPNWMSLRDVVFNNKNILKVMCDAEINMNIVKEFITEFADVDLTASYFDILLAVPNMSKIGFPFKRNSHDFETLIKDVLDEEFVSMMIVEWNYSPLRLDDFICAASRASVILNVFFRFQEFTSFKGVSLREIYDS